MSETQEETKPSRARVREEQAAEKSRGRRAWPGRLARSLLGGSLVGAAVCAVDASYAKAAVQDTGPGWAGLFVSGWGTAAPALIIVGFVFAVLALIAHPAEAPSVARYTDWLRGGGEKARLNRALLLPLGILATWLWIVLSAHTARALLSTVQDARAAGFAIAGASAVTGALCLVLVLAGFSGLRAFVASRPALATGARAWWTGAAALLVVVALGAYGISSGTTGGEGGVFGFMGVLKRLELDLRAPTLLLCVGIGAFAAAGLLRRVWAPIAVLLALAPLGLTVRAAHALDDAPKVAAALERSSPLGKTSLRVLRRLTDRDRDGAAAYFGGGDCDDSNPAINPLSVDIVGNGIDEDCSGKDLVLAAPTAPPKPAASAKPPPDVSIPDDLNVILITVDTLRWDLGYMGYPRNITPAIDALAKRSTVFERAYAMSSYTGKAIGPMMSGKYPAETSMGWKHYNRYPKKDRMVQERLQAAGVHTIAVHCHWYFKADTGLGRGFDVFDLSALPSQGIDATTDTSFSADRLSDAAIKVLSDEANTSKRFYTWIHYFDPHAEYLHHKGTEEFGRKVRDMYDHEVRWTDDQIKRLLDFVQSQPWGKSTAIIVSSDHGEAFGEHKMYRHGFEVWEEIVRVPLVVYVPGLKPKRVKVRRSVIDLVPTILDLMKVKMGEPEDEFDFISGRSLMPELTSEPGAKHEKREILVDMPPGPFNEARRAYIREDMKLIIAGGVRYQLFDLANDPEEKKDLSDDKELMAKQRAYYDQFRARMKEVPLKRPRK